MQKVFFIFSLFFIINYVNYSQMIIPYNLDFEESYSNKIIGWELNKKSIENGYEISISSEQAYSGNKCLQLEHNPNKAESYAIFSQRIDASVYKNKKVRFSAMIKGTQSAGPKVFINVKNKELKVDGIVSNDEVFMLSNDWVQLSVEFEIGNDIQEIMYGILYEYKPTIFIDACKFNIITEQDENFYEKPCKLQEIEKKYLVNFANSYGYIKYFCANKSITEVNWTDVILAGINTSKSITTVDVILDSLNNFWKQLVPQVRFSTTPLSKSDFPTLKDNKHLLANIYYGIPSNICDNYLTHNQIVDINGTLKDKNGVVVQYINNIKKYQGKEIGVSAKIKVKSFYNKSYANLSLRFENEMGNFIDYKVSDSIYVDKWKQCDVVCNIPNNTTRIAVILSFNGYGEAYFDDVSALIHDEKEYAEILKLNNRDFEDYLSFNNENWLIANETIYGGYNVYYSDDEHYSGKTSLIIYNDKEEIPNVPKYDDIVCEKISNDNYICMPLVVQAEAKEIKENDIFKMDYITYPLTENVKLKTQKNENFSLSWKDRTSRLAMVIETWNYVKHFSLGNFNQSHAVKSHNNLQDNNNSFLDEERRQNLNNILIASLQQAAICDSKEDFRNILQGILDITNDVRARAWFSNDDSKSYSFPFLFEFINNKLYVASSEIFNSDTNIVKQLRNDNIKVGDEIVKINGIPIYQFFVDMKKIQSNNESWKGLRELMNFRLGKANSEELFTIKRDNNLFDVIVKRNVEANMISSYYIPEISILSKDIIYMNLCYLDDKSIRSFYDSLKQYNKFIFDLRGNIGVSESFLSLLLQESIPLQTSTWSIPTFTKPDKEGIVFYKQGKSYAPMSNTLKGEFVFLTDWHTGTSSEGFVSTVKKYKLGKVMGQNTQGGMLYSVSIRLNEEFCISLGTAFSYDSNGHNIYNAPISPDILVKTSISDIKNNKDAILETAINYLNKYKHNSKNKK